MDLAIIYEFREVRSHSSEKGFFPGTFPSCSFYSSTFLSDSSLARRFLQQFFATPYFGGLTDARTIKAEPGTQASIQLVVTSRDLKHQQGNYESSLLH